MQPMLDDRPVIEDLAGALLMAPEDFVEVFGTGWAQVSMGYHDFDADPSGGDLDVADYGSLSAQGDLGLLDTPSPVRVDNPAMGVWHLAGEPAQVMLRVNRDTVEIAAAMPEPGRGPADPLVYRPSGIATLPRPGWSRPQARRLLQAAAETRRMTFQWCRYCRTLNAPEDLHADEGNVCMGCAGRVLHVLY